MVSIQKDEVPRMRSQSTDEASYIAKRDILNRLASNEKVRADKTSIFFLCVTSCQAESYR